MGKKKGKKSNKDLIQGYPLFAEASSELVSVCGCQEAILKGRKG